MNALEIVTACLASSCCTALAFWFFAHKAIKRAHADGFRSGRDAEWQDSLFAGIAKDRARREKNGRFKSTRKDA